MVFISPICDLCNFEKQGQGWAFICYYLYSAIFKLNAGLNLVIDKNFHF